MTTDTLSLAAWFLTCNAETESWARDTLAEPGSAVIDEYLRDIATERLAVCEAHRRIVELHKITATRVPLPPFDALTGEPNAPEFDVYCEICGWVSDDPANGCPTVRALATIYTDRPGFREEWRP